MIATEVLVYRSRVGCEKGLSEAREIAVDWSELAGRVYHNNEHVRVLQRCRRRGMQGVGVEKVGDIFCENATGKPMIVGGIWDARDGMDNGRG
jgi:hypothetical protein